MRIYGLKKTLNHQFYSTGRVLKKTIGSDSFRLRKKCNMTIDETPLGRHDTRNALLDGLDVFTVNASGDKHPISIFGINSADPIQSSHDENLVRPILLLHGRTWSSIPVYHLLGGSKQRSDGEESRSLMETLFNYGLQPYTMDFRGFGGTPSDATMCVEPIRCVSDVETVLKWIAQRHGMTGKTTHEVSKDIPLDFPALLGWSQGALVAQMVAQKSSNLISKLVLYGSIYDPIIRYQREPLYITTPVSDMGPTTNTVDSAMEDFTIEGSICRETASRFAEAALITDPHKAVWKHLYQFNNLDPAQVRVPTLVVAGDQDPYAPLRVQAELFSNLGRGSDRTWSILADADHAVHLLDGRQRFAKIVSSFVKNGKKGDNSYYF